MKSRPMKSSMFGLFFLTLLIAGCGGSSGVSTAPTDDGSGDTNTPPGDSTTTAGTYPSYDAKFRTTNTDELLTEPQLIEEFESNVLFPAYDGLTFRGNTLMPDLEMMAFNQGFEVIEYQEINPLEHCHIYVETDYGISFYIPDGTQTFTPAEQQESRNIVSFNGNRLSGNFQTTHHYDDGQFGGNLTNLSMVVMDDSGERIGTVALYSVVLDEDRVSNQAFVPKTNLYVQQTYLNYSVGLFDLWSSNALVFPSARRYSGAITLIKTYGEC